MNKLKLRVHRVDHKCIDTDGCRDGTWDDSYEYIIYDEEGLEVAGMDGYRSEEKARKAGEERLKRLEEK
jgi:hypothetical protein